MRDDLRPGVAGGRLGADPTSVDRDQDAPPTVAEPAVASVRPRLAASAISRRRFLSLSLGALAGAALASTAAGCAQPSPAVSTKKVLVLGAGMSGLTAALALFRRGHDVTVIEYQNRVGGRLLSLPLEGGQFSEGGGGHFRANMPYLLDYIRRFDMSTVTMNDGLPRYIVDGKNAQADDLSDWPWPLADEERGVGVSTTLNHYLHANGLDTETVIDPSWPDEETLRQLDGVTLGELITGVGASDTFLTLLNAHGGTFTDSSPALFSLPDLAYHFGDQNLFRIRGGNELLPQAMAELLGDRIVLDAPVAAIDQTGERVKVTVEAGDEYLGEAIVSTIPFTVLKEIDVSPGWSSGKQRMFDEMEWGNTVKIVVQTKTPAWLSKGVHGWPMAGGDRPWERFIDITGNEPGGYGNGFFYLNGANAEAALARPHGSRGDEVLAAFRADAPDLFDEVITVDDFAWTDQPWIGASFGGPPVGGAWMIEEWTSPEDRLHFAGDWTTMKSGWVEGAIESGLRAARQIDPEAPAEKLTE